MYLIYVDLFPCAQQTYETKEMLIYLKSIKYNGLIKATLSTLDYKSILYIHILYTYIQTYIAQMSNKLL